MFSYIKLFFFSILSKRILLFLVYECVAFKEISVFDSRKLIFFFSPFSKIFNFLLANLKGFNFQSVSTLFYFTVENYYFSLVEVASLEDGKEREREREREEIKLIDFEIHLK